MFHGTVQILGCVLREVVASPNKPSWSFSFSSAHFVLLMKVPVRLITSALHKCSLNDTSQQWDLLWLILICGSGRHIWMTLMGSWVTVCSFFFVTLSFQKVWEIFAKSSSHPRDSCGYSWYRRTCTAEPVTALFELCTILHYNITLSSTYTVKMCGLNAIRRPASFVHLLYVVFPNRTLVALGCRVVQVNPNAESSLRKIKLPKK